MVAQLAVNELVVGSSPTRGAECWCACAVQCWHMKMLYSIAGILVILIGVFYALNSYIYNEKHRDASDNTSMQHTSESPVQVIPISHATAVLRWGDTIIYTDPTGGAKAFEGQPTANIMLVTDIHGDHLELDTLNAIIGSATLIVPQAVKDQLPENLASRVKVLKNGETMTELGFHILAMPMYNLPGSSENFHTKGRGNGYVIEKDGFRVYIAGDTQGIPEMRALTDIDIALVPMNLPYTMDVDEAADAVLEFKPRHVYPYHYRGPDGLADVSRFKELVNAGDPSINVVLLNWYP